MRTMIHTRYMQRSILLLIALLVIAIPAYAANNPGHDTLYVLKIGDNVTGPLNLTGNLTAYGIQTATFLYGSGLDIWANGSTQQAVTKPTIQAAGTQLFIDNPLAGDLRFNTLGGTTNYVRFGVGGISVIVNGTLRVTNGSTFANATINGTANVTGSLFLNSTICSAGQFLQTGATGLVSCATPTGSGSSNLTLADINTNMGNWSADKAGVYANFTSVNANITSINTTYGNRITSIGNWSLEKGSLPNLSLANINTNMGNASKLVGTCGAGLVTQNVTATGIQCVAVSSSSGNVTGGGAAGNISYWTSGTNLASSPIFLSSGNVGIGTGNPTLGKLTIDMASTGDYIALGINVSGNGGGSPAIRVYGGSDHSLFSGYNTGGYSTISLYNQDFEGGQLQIMNSTGGNRVQLSSYADNDGLLQMWGSGSNSNETVHISTYGESYLNGGNVGIGTTVPNQKLQVNGSSNVSGDMYVTGGIYFGGNSNGVLNVTGSGAANYIARWVSTTSLGTSVISDDGSKVGIGTAAPSQLLEVKGNVSVTNTTTLSATPSANSCLYLPGGGKICGNSTCVVIYSPNGLSTNQACN